MKSINSTQQYVVAYLNGYVSLVNYWFYIGIYDVCNNAAMNRNKQ